jgi:hypothetical protein
MNPTPDQIALLDVLNRPLLPELPLNLIDALAHGFQLTRSLDPTTTAQDFLEQLITNGLVSALDTALRQRNKLQPEHTLTHGIIYR